MVIGICAGGTLGHINPALSLINKLKENDKNIKIIFITTTKEKEYGIVNNNDNIDEVYYIKASGLTKNIFKLPFVCIKDILAIKSINKIIIKHNISLMIGMGGYISGLGICIANLKNIKTVIHEQNSVMGSANKFNISKTNYVFLTYEDILLKNKYPDKIKVVTNPRFIETREKINKIKFHNINHILVTSGTNGSKFINDTVCNMINNCNLNKYTITFVTGKKYYDEVVKKIGNKKNIYIKPFSNNLIDEIINADLIISRAGSSTLFEILGAKKRSIIIPSPNVTNNHQYYNAKYFSDLNLIKMLEEENINYKILYDAIINYYKEPYNTLQVSKYNVFEQYIVKLIK